MKDILASSGTSSPKERTGLSLSAVKSLVLRDNDEKIIADFNKDERVLSLLRSLFDAGI